MSRRDTIIIAILVNAALLMVLFATAIRTDHKKQAPMQEPALCEALPEPTLQEDILNQFVAALPGPVAEAEIIPVESSLEIPLEIPLSIPAEQQVVIAEETLPTAKPLVKEEVKKSSGALVSVTVKKGDFLEKIAKANHSTVSAIMQANQLTSTKLRIGQVLKIPVAEKGQKGAVPAAVDGDFYIVKEGDSPWLIASRNHLKLDDLLRLNDLDEQKARRLRPGDRLRIR